MNELTKTEMAEYYRANFWPNTPDILPFELWNASAAKFKIRAALASLLSSCWGMYSGYEFCENDPFPPKEEYNHSEKYQLVNRDWNAPGIVDFIAQLNGIRNAHPAFHEYANIEFVNCENSEIIAFAKRSSSGNRVLVVVNLDDTHSQQTNLSVPMEFLGLKDNAPYEVEDVLNGETFTWQGRVNFVALSPHEKVAHVFVVRQRV